MCNIKELNFEIKEDSKSYKHPRNLNSVICDGKVIGEIGIVHPTVSKKIDKKAAIVFAEIDMRDFAEIANASISYDEPGRFPEMEIDLSFVADKFSIIKSAIDEQNCPLIKGVTVSDIYSDENGKSITIRIRFSHPERTLNGEEVKEVTDKIINTLSSNSVMLKK